MAGGSASVWLSRARFASVLGLLALLLVVAAAAGLVLGPSSLSLSEAVDALLAGEDARVVVTD